MHYASYGILTKLYLYPCIFAFNDSFSLEIRMKETAFFKLNRKYIWTSWAIHILLMHAFCHYHHTVFFLCYRFSDWICLCVISNTIWLSLSGTSIFWKWCFFCMDICKTPSTLADTPLLFLACVNVGYLLVSCLPSSLQAIDTLLMRWDPFSHPLSTFE